MSKLTDTFNKEIGNQTSHLNYFYEYLSEDAYKSYNFTDLKVLQEGVEPDKHRWYEISTTIFKLGEEVFGARGGTDIYSETTGWDDLCIKPEFFEVEEIAKITYQKKVSI